MSRKVMISSYKDDTVTIKCLMPIGVYALCIKVPIEFF